MRNTEDILIGSLIGGAFGLVLVIAMSYAGLKNYTFKKHWYWFLLATAFCCIPIYTTLQGVCIYLYPIKVKGVVYDSSHAIKRGWRYHVRYLYDGEIRFTATGENSLYSTENGDSCTVYISKWFPDNGRVVRE